MVLLIQKKTYNKVAREMLWWALMKKEMPIKYTNIVKDMYDGVVVNTRTCGGLTSNFSIGLH